MTRWGVGVITFMLASCQLGESSIKTVDDVAAASARGNANAQYTLANRLCCGSDTGKNSALAFYWYCTAAKQGHVSAQYRLGELYEQGIALHQTGDDQVNFLLPKDLAKSFMWYDIASDSGDKRSKRKKKRLKKYMDQDKLNESYALRRVWQRQSCHEI